MSKANPKRRWYQFSLKRLLLIVACAVSMCAIFAEFMHSDSYTRIMGDFGLDWLSAFIARPQLVTALAATIGAIFGRFWIGLGLGIAAAVAIYLLFFVGGGLC